MGPSTARSVVPRLIPLRTTRSVLLDRETSNSDAVVTDHDRRSVGQVAGDLIEICQKERCLALWPTCHLASEQHDARLPRAESARSAPKSVPRVTRTLLSSRAA